MGDSKDKRKKGLFLKTLERCRSLGHRRIPPSTNPTSKTRSNEKHRVVATGGYFSVYVGPEKERFSIKTECANHPLFKLLLDQSEMEYMFANKGPLELPCSVDDFHRVLWEMEQEETDAPRCSFGASPMCGLTKSHSGYRTLTPLRLMIPERPSV